MVAIPPGPPRFRQSERGIALLIVMLMAAVLIPFASEFAFQIDVESRTALNVKEQLAIDNAIEGQYQILVTRIEHDAIGNESDSYNDAWNEADLLDRSESAIDVRLVTKVWDEQGKLPLRKLAEGTTEEQAIWKARLIELLKRFRRDTRFDAAGVAEELADEVTRFMRGDNRGQVPKPNTINNSPVLTLDDLHFSSEQFARLRLLEDVREEGEVGLGLHRFVTIYGTGRVNLNTAEQVLLESIFAQDPTLAERIIERRDGAADDAEADADTGESAGNPFTDVNQVNEIEGVSQQTLRANGVVLARDFDVRSNFFSLRIAGTATNTRREELFVIERVPGSDPNGPVEGVRHLLCQERTDRLEEGEGEER
jgi:type II secretory pathway component PulK